VPPPPEDESGGAAGTWSLDCKGFEDTLRRFSWAKRVGITLDLVAESLLLQLHGARPDSEEARPVKKQAMTILKPDEGGKIKLVLNLNKGGSDPGLPPPEPLRPSSEPYTSELDDEDAMLYGDPKPTPPQVTAAAIPGTFPPVPSASREPLSSDILGLLRSLLESTSPHSRGGSDHVASEAQDLPFFRPDFDSEKFLNTLSLVAELGIFEEIGSLADLKTRIELVSAASIAMCARFDQTKSVHARLLLFCVLFGRLLANWSLELPQLSTSDGFFLLPKIAAKAQQIDLARLNSYCSCTSLAFSLRMERLLEVVALFLSSAEVLLSSALVFGFFVFSMSCSFSSMLRPPQFRFLKPTVFGVGRTSSSPRTSSPPSLLGSLWTIFSKCQPPHREPSFLGPSSI